jgi:GT2 family glycosyltransferase
MILAPLQVDGDLRGNLDRNIGPALEAFTKTHPLSVSWEEVGSEVLGTLPEAPEVSVIVPLYGRIDFMEFQLAHFANDPWMAEHVELIYVLDDPKLRRDFMRVARDLSPLFRLPFRIVSYTENYGYAVANNIGARFARAPKLLLLNSDVMPIKAGWLARMVGEYDRLEEPGALGVKLLFEDGSIQHAGMAFEKSEIFEMWLNEHPGKGLPDLSPEEETKEVPAVTAACVMIDLERYGEGGGLSENYLLGDFEDSDLCLKLIEAGYRNYYLPEVSLVHLERQSQNLFSDSSWKTKVTLYNGWQHDRRWNDLITQLMETSR